MGKRFNFTRKNRNSSHQIKRKKIIDSRGFFERIYCRKEFFTLLKNKNIKQINRAYTIKKATLRGMHYQNSPYAEMKIIQCLKGSVFDVAIDLRKNSSTFLKWTSVNLTGENKLAIVIPEGCAHGFQLFEKKSELLYFHTNFYNPKFEGGIRFDDPLIGVKWPLAHVNISTKDKIHPYIDEEFKGITL